jgi:RNase P subunit RPR2
MTFQDEKLTGELCPDCDEPLYYEMNFSDTWHPVHGHDTIDRPMIVCYKCNYAEDYEEDCEDYEE